MMQDYYEEYNEDLYKKLKDAGEISDEEITGKMYSSMSDDKLTSIPKKKSLKTGIQMIDNEFGFPTGYYLMVGNQGVGKSWFSLWLARVFYKYNQVTSVYFSLEMPELLVRKRILQQWNDINLEGIDRALLNNTVPRHAIDLMQKDVITIDEFYPDNSKKRTVANFKKWLDKYYELGYRIFLFDHFHELSGSSNNDANQSVVEQWGEAFQQTLKKYNDIWLFIFAQPKSSDFEKKILTRNSIRGSKALVDKCDYVMSLNKSVDMDEDMAFVRNKNNGEVLLYLDKSRYTPNPNIGFNLLFDSTGNFS